MSYCLNPNCQSADSNPTGAEFCHTCGSKLLLMGRYRALKLIGQGGFGRTFLAIDESEPSKPRCVIKQFLPQTQDPNHAQKAAELFEQEAVRLETLGKHSQIPNLLAHFIQDGQPYLVQEFIDGQNLAQELQEIGAFSERQIRDLLNSLLPVVQFIHAHNIIHRDIKPENIIRRCDGQLALVDFGAAKYVTGTTLATTGTVIGSASYVAPEQSAGRAVFASDIYSLGLTCIHLLTQIKPFDLYSDSEGDWVWRDYLNNPVSDELGQILDKMLYRATKQRYQSASNVLQDLNLGLHQRNDQPAGPAVVKTLQSQSWRCVQTLQGHSDWVNCVAISPDGEILVSGSRDKTIKVWQLSTGKILQTLAGHTSFVFSVTISPDGQTLASGSEDTTIKLWQLGTGRQVRTLGNWFSGHSHWVSSVAISPDGQMLVSGSDDKTIKLWRLSKGRELQTLEGHSGAVRSLAISLDGQTLVSGSTDKTIKIWQLATGKELHTLKGHSNWVRCVTINPNGQTIISSSDDKTLKLWELKTGKLIGSMIGHLSWVRSVAISPDGQTIASGSMDKTIKIWQLNTAREICTLRGHDDEVYAVAFSPDGQTLVSSSGDTTIKLWRCE